MIICIPVSESKGLDSTFEADFGRAISMVIYNLDSLEVHNVPVDPIDKGAAVPAFFETVLCSSIERDVWRDYLYQGVRFFGMTATTALEAAEKFQKGQVTAVNIFTNAKQKQKEAASAGAGCGCGAHRHGASGHACGGKSHGHGAGVCGGHGKRHGGCGCG